jgi:hypothetical protein
MDKIALYQQILSDIVRRHASFQPANGNIKTSAVIDATKSDFMVIDAGWSDSGRRIYDVVLHFRLEGETVFVERDNTDAEVVRELIEEGIDKNDLILAFNTEPFQKVSNLIAA